jgi:hypothetical protein
VTDILATDFPSWRGTVSPSAPFNQELGNKLYFGVRVVGSEFAPVSLSHLQYTIMDTFNGLLSSTGDFSTANYSPNWVGVIDGPGGQHQFITSGSGTQQVDEIWGVGVAAFIPLPGSSIPGGPPQSGSLAGFVSDIPGFTFTTTYNYPADAEIGFFSGSAEVDITPAGNGSGTGAVPAPPGLALGLVAAATFAAVRRFRRPIGR